MPANSVGGFTSRILEHFCYPRNAGVAKHYNHCYLEQENPWLIHILFTLRVEKGLIEEVKFKTQSCVTTTACASALSEMVQGKTLHHALSITPEQLSAYLGTVPPEKMHCCRLAVATLRNALHSPSRSGAVLKSSEGEK